MKTIQQRPGEIRSRTAAGLWAAAFLFFLIYSAPHRVHHFFDPLLQTAHDDADHEQPNSNRNDRSSSDSNCVFYVTASQCHVGLAWQVSPALLPILVRPLANFQEAGNNANFLPTAFHIRAPPLT